MWILSLHSRTSMQGVTPHATTQTSECTLCAEAVFVQLLASVLNDFKNTGQENVPCNAQKHGHARENNNDKGTQTHNDRIYYIRHDKSFSFFEGKGKGWAWEARRQTLLRAWLRNVRRGLPNQAATLKQKAATPNVANSRFAVIRSLP